MMAKLRRPRRSTPWLPASALGLWLLGMGIGSAHARARGHWLEDARGFQQAMRRRQAAKMPVLLYFYTDWCPYCRQLEANTLNTSVMERYLSEVIAVQINPERGGAERGLGSRYGVTGYPSLYLLPMGSDQAVSLPTNVPAEQLIDACRRYASRPSPPEAKRPAASPAPARSRPRAVRPATPVPEPPVETRDPEAQVTVSLKNGRRIRGWLVSESAEELVIDRGQITLRIPRSRVEQLEP
jgi:thiol-disulfide isomerase/thioredoxin